MRRLAVLAVALLAAASPARPKLIEFKSLPQAPKAIAAALAKEKPGPMREALLSLLETRLREKGSEVSDPDQLDAIAATMFQKIFDDMAAPTEVWTWEGDDGPRGEVLIRGHVLLLPGLTTSGFSKRYTVKPMGKRIDRGYLNTECTVEVGVAKSEADWHQWIEKKGWGAALHPVLATDDVARVVLSIFSPGTSASPAPRHERPVWVAFFKKEKGEWQLLDFPPAAAKEQKLQEANALPADPKERLTDPQRRLVLALRMDDVKLLNPARTAFLGREASWFDLTGLTECPVDAKTLDWLDPYRASEHPLVRAAAVLKVVSLGGAVQPAELLDAVTRVKVKAVQAAAMKALDALLEGSAEPVGDEDQAALAKLGGGGDVKVLKGVARVKVGNTLQFFTKGDGGWAAPK